MLTATAAATVPRLARDRKKKRGELLRRAKALGWSQNELARRIGKDVGHTSRVLRGLMVSALVWTEAERVIACAEQSGAGEDIDREISPHDHELLEAARAGEASAGQRLAVVPLPGG